MSLWGNKDLIAESGTITINTSTGVITGSSTTFTTAGVAEGDVIVVGAGATYGYGVIDSVASNTSATLKEVAHLIPDANDEIQTNTAYFINQEPKSSFKGGQFAAPDAKSNYYSSVFGVDVAEEQFANSGSSSASALQKKYNPAHAGWVGVTTYNNADGTLRVKTEVLVASSSISGDQEDSKYPNS